MQLTVSELIKQLRAIENRNGGDKLVVCKSGINPFTGQQEIIIVETLTIDDDEQEVILHEEGVRL